MNSEPRPVYAVVTGRMGSSRMPGKTMAELAGVPALTHIISRLQRVPSLDGIVVATTVDPEDDVICECAQAMAVPAYRGSVTDVLGRVLNAAVSVGAATIVRITGDAPLTDPAIVEAVIAAFLRDRPDFASNCLGGSQYPIGLAVEIFPTAQLELAERCTVAARDREHVTLFFEEHPEWLRLLSVAPTNARHRRPNLRLTLDTPKDYEVIATLYDALYDTDACFGLDAVLAYLERHPEVAMLNADVPQVVP
ncbi:MAG TPA: glycosyltransferase family protein [Solirubrobacteraceae bacterium]|jgi:spore coat polysaccharide biosynthesis protein SpsF|nr:glycosyltransferase family protein [Solirubrobacteraceae bacterium]